MVTDALKNRLVIAGLVLAAAGMIDGGSAEPADATRTRPTGQTVVISWVGDICLAGSVARLARLRGMDYVLAEVSDTLNSDSFSVGNLECSVSTIGKPQKHKEYTFQAPPVLLDGLKSGGIDAVSLANNHVLDYGRDALVEMLGHLDSAGIQFGGAGVDISSAAAPVPVTMGGRKFFIICYSRVVPDTFWYARPSRPGVIGAYDPQRLLQSIAVTKDSGDIVAVYLHWGKEMQRVPEPYQQVLARRCIEAGADLVVGSHPHALQGFEYYQGKLIAYSLGDFIFSSREHRPTVILRTVFVGDSLTSASIIPCRLSHLRPEFVADDGDRQNIFRDITAISYGVVVDSLGRLGPAMP